MGDFLPGDRYRWTTWWWQAGIALMVTVALVAGGVHWLGGGRPQAVSAAEQFADAAAKAFGGTDAAASTLTAAQRSAGLPVDPVAGLTTHTAAGPVQVVLPGGLGVAQATSGGRVVYPDNGAGFDFLAENTATGHRTVARINGPDGVRMVTTFVRTPADTVMLAHTNGYLTINRATPAAETVGMFSPAETRDANGTLVPSSYVTRQVRPGLYQLSEVIDPGPGTAWPVYVDPPLQVSGLPEFGFSDVTGAISSAASAVSDAVTTVASATVTGATAVGTFVKNNPLESAMLVGGVALALTGVGGPAGAAAIAAATVNLGSATMDIVATAMPDNELVGNIALGLDVASAFTPQGAVKKVAEEGAEQLLKHADDIVDVAKVAPTPPAQLSDEIVAAGAKPPVPGVSTPKAPNAPPAGNVVPGGEHAWPLPPSPADRRLSTDVNSRVTPRSATRQQVDADHEFRAQDGTPLDPYSQEPIQGTPHLGHLPDYKKSTADRMSSTYGVSRRERNEWEQEPSHYQLEQGRDNSSHKNEIPYRPGDEDKMYRRFQDWHRDAMDPASDKYNPRLAQDPTAQRRHALTRPTGADEQRQIQQAGARQRTDRQRDDARDGAREANSSSRSLSSDSNNSSTHKSSNGKKKKKPKKKKSSQHHPKPKG